jgi:hypothetical protein
LKFHRSGGIGGRAMRAEERAGTNQVVCEVRVLTDIAFHGLRFVGKTESASILSGYG